MDYERFDHDETVTELDAELEFEELDDTESLAEVELLVARVRAARLAGA